MLPGFLPALLGLGRLAHRLSRWDDLLDMYRRELEGGLGPQRPVEVEVQLCLGHAREGVVGYVRHASMLNGGRQTALRRTLL